MIRSLIEDTYPVQPSASRFLVVEPRPEDEDDEFFLVRGDMPLAPYLVTGFNASKKSDYRICDFTNRKDSEQQQTQDDYVEVDNSKTIKTGLRRPVRKQDRTAEKTKAERNKPAADVVTVQKKIATAPMSRYEKQKLKQRRQDKPQHWNNRPKIKSDWSIKPDPEWQNIRELSLNELARAELDANKVNVEDVARRGVIPFFDKAFEKVTPRAPRVVKSSGIVPHNAGFFEDEFLTEAAADDGIEVIATDEILTLLMSASHTRYSWHVKIFKSDGKIIIDKAEDSIVEKVTVRESARQHVPVVDDPVQINRPNELHDEATQLQVDVCQMMLGADAQKFEDPEFEMTDETHDHQGRKMYKYRKFTLPPCIGSREDDNVTVLTRVEIDAVRMVNGKPQYALIKAMNEYDNKAGSYRIQLDKQPGALSAAEYRNHSPKMAKWISQAILAGAETLVLGWVTRDQPHSNKKHQLLGCMTEKLELLQQQLGVKPRNAWALLRSLIDQIRDESCPEGEYVLIKAPLKPTLRLMYIGENDDEEESDE